VASNDSIADTLDINGLTRILHGFLALTGIPIDFLDPKGYPIIEQEPTNRFCEMIRSHPEGRKRCVGSLPFDRLNLSDNPRLFMELCHACVGHLGMPVMVGGTCIGFVTSSQLMFKQPDKEDLDAMLISISDLDLATPEDLISAYTEIPVIPPSKCMVAIEFVRFVSEYIAGIILYGKAQASLAEKGEKIRELERLTAEMEQFLREAEMRDLQARVKPHFLFNSLNIISRLIMFEQKDQALDAVYSLSSLLRCSLGHKDTLITLEEEIKYVNDYVKIMNYRFGERVRTTIYVNEEVVTALVPPFCIQTVVENCYTHGFSGKLEGSIAVRADCEGDQVRIEVKDNGVGMCREQLSLVSTDLDISRQSRSGTGLKNVHRRLVLSFGPSHGLRIESQEGIGTIVYTIIPFIRAW
jgi:two-component system LytT family sensor kinase